MTLFTVEYHLATEDVIFSGKALVAAHDDIEARRILRESIGGAEGAAVNVTVEEVSGGIHWLKRGERLANNEFRAQDHKAVAEEMSRDLHVFELAARCNVVAKSERQAFKRFSSAVGARMSDGQYVKLYRDTVLDTEVLNRMSDYERNMLHKGFITMVRG